MSDLYRIGDGKQMDSTLNPITSLTRRGVFLSIYDQRTKNLIAEFEDSDEEQFGRELWLACWMVGARETANEITQTIRDFTNGFGLFAKKS